MQNSHFLSKWYLLKELGGGQNSSHTHSTSHRNLQDHAGSGWYTFGENPHSICKSPDDELPETTKGWMHGCKYENVIFHKVNTRAALFIATRLTECRCVWPSSAQLNLAFLCSASRKLKKLHVMDEILEFRVLEGSYHSPACSQR